LVLFWWLKRLLLFCVYTVSILCTEFSCIFTNILTYRVPNFVEKKWTLYLILLQKCWLVWNPAISLFVKICEKESIFNDWKTEWWEHLSLPSSSRIHPSKWLIILPFREGINGISKMGKIFFLKKSFYKPNFFLLT
jgi:hypothetical protein